MERNFIRASLVIVWRCPAFKNPDLKPDSFFGEGSTFSVVDGGISFQSPVNPQTGLSDELSFSPGKFAIACSDPRKIPEIFERAWKVFGSVEGLELLAAGYNAEYEWLDLPDDAGIWIANNYVKPDHLGSRKFECTGLSLIFEACSEKEQAPCFVTLEPRAGVDKALFAHVVQHFETIPKDLDNLVKGIIPFASSVGSDIVEPLFPSA